MDFELAIYEVEVEENMGEAVAFNFNVISLYPYSFELWQVMLKVSLRFS